MTQRTRPRPPVVPISDEPTLRADPPWGTSTPTDQGTSFPLRRTLPAPSLEEPEADTQSSPMPLRVAVLKTVLDDRILMVRVLDDGVPVPSGSVEACLVLSKRLDLDG